MQVDLWRSADNEWGIQLLIEGHNDDVRFICCCPCPAIDMRDEHGVRFGTCRRSLTTRPTEDGGTMFGLREHLLAHVPGDAIGNRPPFWPQLESTAEAIEYWLRGNGDWDAIVRAWADRPVLGA